MISTLRSNFPTEPAQGHTMGTPEDSPRMGCTHLNSRWRVLIFRVQLMSLEYNRKVSSRMSFDSHITQLHSSYLNRGTQKQRQFRGGPKGHSQTSQLQVRPADQAGYHELTASVFVGAGLAETPCAPCCETERVVTGHSVTPHTHTHTHIRASQTFPTEL